MDERLLEDSTEDLYDNAPCGYLSTLPDGTIVKVNQTFLAWTGYARDELLAGVRFQELLTVAGKIFHETHYAPLLRMQGFVREIALDLVCRERRLLPALLNSVQRRDAEGRALYNRITVFNATERREYERELLKARQKAELLARSRSDLLAMIAHDIRTPLGAITSAVRLLERTQPSLQQQKYVRALKSSTQNLLGLVNDILDFSKIEAGKAPLEERSFEVREWLHGLIQGLLSRAEEKGVAVHVDVDERLPAHLVGDAIKIGQVLTNLVSNAIKFTEKGSVTVDLRVLAVSPDAVHVGFRVSDTGIGIAPERLSRIFDDFTQANQDIGVKYGGSGLGLAICRKLVELYGSKMVVESEPGRGSTFSFELRLKPDAERREGGGGRLPFPQEEQPSSR